MCKIIKFKGAKKPQSSTEELETEHQIISFTEMNEGIEDARILRAKISLFAKKLINDGYDNALVYEQMFKTANSMSCLYSETYEDFRHSAHDELVKCYPDLCYDELGIDDIS